MDAQQTQGPFDLHYKISGVEYFAPAPANERWVFNMAHALLKVVLQSKNICVKIAIIKKKKETSHNFLPEHV